MEERGKQSEYCSEYCDGCAYLCPTEELQARGESHFCHKFNEVLKHLGYHPHIPRLDVCKPDDYRKRS